MRLGDLGQVLDDVQNNKVASLVQRAPAAIVLAVQRQPGTNTVAGRRRACKALVESLRTQLPASLELRTLFDRSISIRESVTDVKFTLLSRSASW